MASFDVGIHSEALESLCLIVLDELQLQQMLFNKPYDDLELFKLPVAGDAVGGPAGQFFHQADLLCDRPFLSAYCQKHKL
jgi:hypothetical protein